MDDRIEELEKRIEELEKVIEGFQRALKGNYIRSYPPEKIVAAQGRG